MQLKECYDAFGGSYEAVSQRIPKEEIIRKFAIKFLADPSFDNLISSLDSEDYQEAFRAVHSLKGVSANLGFQRLEKSSAVLTELLRGSEGKQIDREECQRLFEDIAEDYRAVVDSLKKLDE